MAKVFFSFYPSTFVLHAEVFDKVLTSGDSLRCGDACFGWVKKAVQIFFNVKL